MSHPPSIYGRNAVLGDDRSSANSSLLTPPLLPLDKHDAPFKPSLSDTTSLNMKKRHKHGSHHSEATSQLAASKSSTGYFAFDTQALAKIRSMVEIRSFPTPEMSPTASPPIEQSSSTRKEPCYRRWTLPSKAPSTQSVTTLRSIVRQTIWNEKRASPAMITLRRATAKSSSRRSTGLTFFPEPEFDQNQGLLASFVKTLTSEPGNTGRLQKASENNVYQSDSGSSRMRQPSTRAMAPTIQTAITIEPERFVSRTLPAQSQSRRCSTRYMCGTSSYEVIWEDNDRPTMVQKCSGVSTEMGLHDRRDSAAASQLESTLKRCRETSQASPPGSIFSSNDGRSSIRKSFSFMLPTKSEQTLSRTVHETTLQNLPRSRTGEQLKSKNLGHLNASLISPRRCRTERQGAKRGSEEDDAAYLDEDRWPLLSLSPDMLG